jgi:hypothetical protein
MRLSHALAVSAVLSLPAAGSAQDWVEYKSMEDRFAANFPGSPSVTQTTYTSQYGADLPSRVYSAAVGARRYTLTVVDYSRIEEILTERTKLCVPHAETCLGSPTSVSTGVGNWRIDYNGAIVYATRRYIMSDATITEFLWANPDLVNGQQIQMTNRDGSRTFAGIYMHDRRLYIIEGTVPEAYPEPSAFTYSLQWLDEKGNTVRYRAVYTHFAPPPSR